ncbi:hypothetical protein Hanom_Chr05g00446791 [Helianthus anomalus]
MGLRIQERGAVFKGILFVHLANDLFLFNRSHLLLYLIHSVLFQNAYQLAFFAWSGSSFYSTFDIFQYEYEPKSCFHKNKADFGIKISMG